MKDGERMMMTPVSGQGVTPRGKSLKRRENQHRLHLDGTFWSKILKWEKKVYLDVSLYTFIS